MTKIQKEILEKPGSEVLESTNFRGKRGKKIELELNEPRKGKKCQFLGVG